MNKVTDKITLKSLALKNRIMRSAVHSFLGNTDGTISEAEYDMYKKLAQNNIGMIVTGHVSISPMGMANEEQTAIYDDKFIPQFTKLKNIVEPYGAKIIVQINHAGPRAIHNNDLAGVMERDLKKGKHCRALTIEDISKIKNQFITGAKRLAQAGVDGVQLHAAHSYLISQFLDPTFNQRNDIYGGNVKNRFRLLKEIIIGIKAECPTELPLFVKVNNDTATDNEQYEADMIYILRECAKLGVAAVELSGYDFLSEPKSNHNYYLERASRLKKAVPDLPIILVGGIRSLADMEAVLAEGIDIVSLGRPLISEPDLITRLLGESTLSARCVSCNRCFAIPKIQPGIRCVFNRNKPQKHQ